MSAKTKLDVWNIDYIDEDKWEEVPAEDLWEDGELDSEQVKEKLYQEVIRQGVWKLIRRKQ
jgi:hypothetical protein